MKSGLSVLELKKLLMAAPKREVWKEGKVIKDDNNQGG